MIGYPFVLPDMVGGNGYNNQPPSKEMYIRWMQANVFMPVVQFSYTPWDFDQQVNCGLRIKCKTKRVTPCFESLFNVPSVNDDCLFLDNRFMQAPFGHS